MEIQSPTVQAGRRWAPLVAGGVGFVLIFTLFPNPLRPPPQNPNAAAEYAPKTSQNQPAFSESDLATSDGVGVSSGPGFQAPPPPPPARIPGVFRPRQKPCFGSPARQTEDPLSPPCVPYFDGDNGGATAKGVTRDEIKVIVYNDWGVRGDLNTAYDPDQEPSGGSLIGGAGLNNSNIVRTFKAHLRYFTERFQTYGRFVRFIGYPSQGGGSSCAQRGGDASSAALDYEPFAAIDFSFGNTSCFTDQIAAEHHVMTFGINWDLPGYVYENNKPYIFGFFPDQDIEASWTASLICRTLGGEKRARFAGSEDLRGRTRTFGLVSRKRQYEFPEDRVGSDIAERVKDQCGRTFDKAIVYSESGTGNSGPSAGEIVAQFNAENITTVVCVCPNDRLRQMQNSAEGEDYFPEWIYDHGNRMIQSSTIRGTHLDGMKGFGITHFWRLPEMREQYHYRAYKSEEPNTEPNLGQNANIYYQLLNLFTGLQAAGPGLTAESVRKGMFTFRYGNQADGFMPTGGYGPYHPRAQGDFSFIDSAALFWWDPNGQEPGRGSGSGCIKLVKDGFRYYAEEFPTSDRVLFGAGGVCTADLIQR